MRTKPVVDDQIIGLLLAFWSLVVTLAYVIVWARRLQLIRLLERLSSIIGG